MYGFLVLSFLFLLINLLQIQKAIINNCFNYNLLFFLLCYMIYFNYYKFFLLFYFCCIFFFKLMKSEIIDFQCVKKVVYISFFLYQMFSVQKYYIFIVSIIIKVLFYFFLQNNENGNFILSKCGNTIRINYFFFKIS